MSGKAKALGLALLAVFAFGAIMAQGASAVEHEFEVTETPAWITGENVLPTLFITGGAWVQCNETTLTGTVAEGESNPASVTVTPQASGCKSSFGTNATVTNEGCSYTFGSNTTEDLKGATPASESAAVHLKCGGGKGQIKVVTSGCTMRFTDKSGEATLNQNIHGITYQNNAPIGEIPEDMTIRAHSHDIHFTAEGLCPFGGIANGTHTDGKLEADVTVRAYEDLGADAFGDPIEGEQVGITVREAPFEE